MSYSKITKIAAKDQDDKSEFTGETKTAKFDPKTLLNKFENLQFPVFMKFFNMELSPEKYSKEELQEIVKVFRKNLGRLQKNYKEAIEEYLDNVDI